MGPDETPATPAPGGGDGGATNPVPTPPAEPAPGGDAAPADGDATGGGDGGVGTPPPAV